MTRTILFVLLAGLLLLAGPAAAAEAPAKAGDDAAAVKALNEQYERLLAEAKAGAGGGGGGGSTAASTSPPHLANASSVARSYLALKKIDPKGAAAYLKNVLEIKENKTETVANAAIEAAIDAAGRLFNITFG